MSSSAWTGAMLPWSTTVPAQSRKTAGMMDLDIVGDPQLLRGFFGDSEGKRHARAAGRGDDADSVVRGHDDQRLFWMLGVDAEPALGDGEVGGAKEAARVIEDEIVDLLLVEDVDVQAVFMGIAEGERAVGSLGDEGMDAPAVEFRGLFGDAAAERVQGFADLKGGVKAESEPGGEGRAELPALRLGGGAHHLELAAGEATGGEVLRVESLEVVPAADDDGFGEPAAGAGFDDGKVDG